MNRHDIELLLDRYLNKETSALENEQVENWLIENEPENAQWKSLDNAARDQWMSNLFSEIQTTISIPSNTPLSIKSPIMPTRMPLWRSIAAVAAMLTVFITLFMNWPAVQDGINPVKVATLSVPENEKKQITLADGSVVWINSLTELRYPKTFSGHTREVYLSGEAYFDIRHNASKPFIVHTGQVITTVLGTAFNINAGKNSDRVIVTVTRGKVSVADQDHFLGYITPNQQLNYNLNSKEEIKTTVDAEKVAGWQGDLHFDDITFENAASILEARFKVRIGFSNDKVKNCRFSGTSLNGDNSLEQILKIICAFNQATYTHNKNGSITIDGRGCN